MSAPLQTHVIQLGAEGWERWSISSSDAPVRLSGKEVFAAGDRVRRVFAVPARSVVAMPLWVGSSDEAIIRETVRLELDLRGLLNRQQVPENFEWRKVVSGERSLILASIFPAALPEPVTPILFEAYEASPFVQALSSNSLTLWREGNDIVAAFTRDAELVYWETFDQADTLEEISQGLRSTLLLLLAEEILLPPLGWNSQVDSLNLRPPLPEVFADAPLSFRPALLPSLKNAGTKWLPPAAFAAGKSQAIKIRRRRIFQLAGLAYALLIVGIGIYIAGLRWQAARLSAEQEQLQAKVGLFQPIIRKWRYLEPTAETESFPLEILHQVVKVLPPEGIQLALFDMTDGKIRVDGTATSASLASHYFASLSGEAELQRVKWGMSAPALQPDNSARFQIEGELR